MQHPSEWLLLSSGRRACVGLPSRRRFARGLQGFFVLARRRPGDWRAPPMDALGHVRDGAVTLERGLLTMKEAAELAAHAAELAAASAKLLSEPRR